MLIERHALPQTSLIMVRDISELVSVIFSGFDAFKNNDVSCLSDSELLALAAGWDMI